MSRSCWEKSAGGRLAAAATSRRRRTCVCCTSAMLREPVALESSADRSPPPMQAFRRQSARTPRDLQGCFRAQGRGVTQGRGGLTHLRSHPEKPSPARNKPPQMRGTLSLSRSSTRPNKVRPNTHSQFESRAPPNPTTSDQQKHSSHLATNTHPNLLESHRGPH